MIEKKKNIEKINNDWLKTLKDLLWKVKNNIVDIFDTVPYPVFVLGVMLQEIYVNGVEWSWLPLSLSLKIALLTALKISREIYIIKNEEIPVSAHDLMSNYPDISKEEAEYLEKYLDTTGTDVIPEVPTRK